MLPGLVNDREIRGKLRTRSPAHRDWVRGHRCCVPDCQLMPIEVAHVRTAATAGVGMKSSDAFTLSLCREHHAEAHRIGERTFQKLRDVDMAARAREFFERSPHKSKLDSPYV